MYKIVTESRKYTRILLQPYSAKKPKFKIFPTIKIFGFESADFIPIVLLAAVKLFNAREKSDS